MTFTVSEEYNNMRLDAYIATVTELSRSSAAKLIEAGRVTVNGFASEKKCAVTLGDLISVDIPQPIELDALPEDIPLDIVFEDEDIIVINKPSGMVVHPAPGNYSGTLVNAILYHCKDSLSGIGGVVRPGIVHRIDKDTSGLLVVAKNDTAHILLSDELKRHGIVREYHALVKGGFNENSGTIDLPIGRHPVDRKRMAVLVGSPSAKEAITHYEVLEQYNQVTYIKLILETGRTHQIRVHMSHKGHALIGDEVYGQTKTKFEKEHQRLLTGQALHAKKLTLTHPRTKERLSFECELPDNFKKLIEILRADI